MNKSIQMLVEAVNMIPRQFYPKYPNDNISESVYERLVSQLTIRYRKLTGGYCRTELLLPTSENIQKFAYTPENKAMIRKLTTGIASLVPKPTFLMEQASELPLPVTIVEVKMDHKLQRGVFYWDFFKLHFLVEQNRGSCGIYFIINQDVISVQKKISAYYERGLYTSLSAENIFFLIKKDYNSDIVVLNYKGESS